MEPGSTLPLDAAIGAATLLLAAWTTATLLAAGRLRVRVRRPRPRPLRWLPAFSVAFALSAPAAGAGGRSPLDRTPSRHHAPAPPWARPGGATPPLPPGGPGAPSPLPPWEARAQGAERSPQEASGRGRLRLGRPALPGRLLFPGGGGAQRNPSAPTAHPALHGGHRPGDRARPLFARAGRRAHRTGATYVVRPGDSLWSISAALLGSDDPARIAAAWPRLYRLNARRIGPDPGLIHPGTVLRLPASWAVRTAP